MNELHRETERERYERLRASAAAALESGCLDEAQAGFDQALDQARALGDPDLVDLAYCNRTAVAVRRGEAGNSVARLREMLLRTGDPRVARYSAYNLALAYDTSGGYQKALFYARIALRYSDEIGQPEERASSLNQIGNVLAAMNRFTEARDHYGRALDLLTDEPSVLRALVLDNLGYCEVVQGDYPDGFGHLFDSLRILRRADARLYECDPRLALAFAYLHVDRPQRAVVHAARALELAEEANDPRGAKYALLLLGEGFKLNGDLDSAHECFALLQETYYPDMPQVPGMLLDLDVCKIINLRA